MACANCGSNTTCNCVIVAGDGINVDGIGSPEFPYVISTPEDPEVMIWCSDSQEPAGYSLIREDGSQEYFTSGGISLGFTKPEMFIECKCPCESGTGGTIYPDWQSLGINGFGEMTIIADGIETAYLKDLSVTTTKIDNLAITTAKLADQAVIPSKLDISIADATERDSLTPFAGMIVFQEDNKMMQIYDGSSWQNIPRVLAKTTLTSAADILTLSNIPARDTLKLKFVLINTGGTISCLGRANNDSGASKYSSKESVNSSATFSNHASTNGLWWINTTYTAMISGEVDIRHVNGDYTVFDCETLVTNGSVADVPEYIKSLGLYDDSAKVSSLSMVNGGTGDYAIGSYAEVIG